MVTAIERNVVEKAYINDFLSFMVDDCLGSLSYKLGDQKAAVASNLEIIRDIAALDDGPASASVVNQVFDQNKGKMFTWMYSFKPGNKDVICETLTISFSLRLGDNFVVLYRTKKSIFGKREWQEKKLVPAAISAQSVVDNLAIGLAPFLFNATPAPSIVMEELKTQAKNTPYVAPSDDERRTIYDPIKKLYVVVDDPEILKLIPTVWSKSTGSFVLPSTNYKAY